MVLTNFELWAADGSTGPNLPLDFAANNPHARHLNPFDTRVVPQLNTNLNHLSSNGYYGFSYVNAVQDNNNNDNNNINMSNINNSNNNNNSTTINFMANDVNGMNNSFTSTLQQQEAHISSVNFGSSAYAADNTVNVARCKKRYFDAAAEYTATNNSNEIAIKRCRFDDDHSAQYCNDFFKLPATQIATQSCYMLAEEGCNMAECEPNLLNPQLQSCTPHHQQQQQQQLQQQSQQQQQQHLYHQQQHYQDIQFASIKCHFIHNKKISCDTLPLNNNTCKIVDRNTENFFKIYKPNQTNNSIENDKYDDYIANNDFEVDDATLFAQLHGGCLHHHHYHDNLNNTVSNGVYNTVIKKTLNNQLQDNYYYKEF